MGWKRLSDTEDYELHAPAPSHSNHSTDEVPHSHHPGTEDYSDDRQKLIHQQHVRDVSTTVSQTPSRKPSRLSRPPLGKPTVKRAFHTLHLFAAAISLICLALAITAVANENVSWRLGVDNYQLIVLGFLLGIMNLCLGSVTPTFFLLLEARFGPSTLQNYDGILRNEVFSSGLSPFWRTVLSLVLALPLGLSVAYKTFVGGESTKTVDVFDYLGNTSYYGMFAPPGLQSLGQKTGVSLFSNATLPFAAASSNQNGIEPTLPTEQQAYGFNMLLLNNESAAALDIPQPSYISAVQALLAGGESWNVTSSVKATVARYNHSISQHPKRFKSDFMGLCNAARASSGAYTHMSMINDWSLMLLNHPSPGNQTLQYIGYTPDPGIEHIPECREFLPYAKLFDMSRELCHGTWSITRGTIELLHGYCYGVVPTGLGTQEVILHNSLFLGVWYMPSLVELLGPFATSRNNSQWTHPSMAMSMAAMLWSRITVLHSPMNQTRSFEAPIELAALTFEEAGLIYRGDDKAVYTRPTLKKSYLLYFVLAIQPLLILLILGLCASMFQSTPLDKGFGLVSILSGINRNSLDTLAGAALSGELARSVKLILRPVRENQNDAIEYRVVLPSSEEAPLRNERLRRNVIYY
ncbi:MAG: hypothetical protein L6R40_004520 [Gallowayella cf. fulva]|nr:MAG: hypothetical protein L6R40_004520 [Xanthomendoza cf. fulva]